MNSTAAVMAKCVAEDSTPYVGTVLVLDDEPDMVAWVSEALEQEGLLTFTATAGQEALSFLRVLKVDVIVSDIMMPNVNGLELLELAKRQSPDVEVILMTGYAAPAIAFEAWGKGACGLLQKPFSAEQLVGAVSQALWRTHLRRQSWPWREP